MKIWGRANSINVMKVLWTADECGLKHERTDVGLAFGGNDQKWHLDMNPNGVVPTIDDGGRIIWESNTIVRYLAAKYAAGSLWPNDPGERSEAERCAVKWSDIKHSRDGKSLVLTTNWTKDSMKEMPDAVGAGMSRPGRMAVVPGAGAAGSSRRRPGRRPNLARLKPSV